MKRYVYAMSKSKSDLGDYFESRTRPVIEHLIKLYLYPGHESTIHWRREVANFLNSTDTLKGSHKLPTARFILHNTIDVHLPFIQSYARQVVYEYGGSSYWPAELDALSTNIKNYFVWIANRLSKEPQVSYPEIYEWLERNGF